jgi:DHA1 family multidrug resistance protein-like MFS transporter
MAVMDTIRDAPFGQLVRWINGNRVFLYPEERPDFPSPEAYTYSNLRNTSVIHSLPTQAIVNARHDSEVEDITRSGIEAHCINPERFISQPLDIEPEIGPVKKLPNSCIKSDQKKEHLILIDWYTTDDAANPRNWSSSKKAFVTLQIWYVDHQEKCFPTNISIKCSLYTFVVYCGSAIYVPSEGSVVPSQF